MKSALLILLAAFLSFSGTQTNRQPSAQVEGIVAGIDGNPIPQARILLRNERQSAGKTNDSDYGTISGPDGRFVLKEIVPGHYRLMATLKGYLDAEYGQARPGRPGAVLDLTTALTPRDLLIRMTPGGAISGRVYNQEGRPLEGARVQLIRPRYQENGEVMTQMVSNANTNDLGEYRMYWVAPGSYYVVAAYNDSDVRHDRRFINPLVDQVQGHDDLILPTFYPNAFDVTQATAVKLEPGAELRGIDFSLIRINAVRLRGQVINGNTGMPAAGATVDVRLRQDGWANVSNVSSTVSVQNGEFEIRRVPSGTNTIYVNLAPKPPDFRPFYAQLDVQVGDKDVSDLRVVLEHAPPVTGHVTFDSEIAGRQRPQLIFEGVGNNARGVGNIAASDGTFSASVQSTGLFRLRLLSDDYYIRSARSGSRDVMRDGIEVNGTSTEPLDLQLAPANGSIQGTVTDERGGPGIAAQVVLIPASRQRFDLYDSGVTDQLGHFDIKLVAPGDYKLFAWDDLEPFAYYDRNFLQPYESLGIPVHVAENGTTTTHLRLLSN
jgi:Carboxypeptidase regulatory-like domain